MYRIYCTCPCGLENSNLADWLAHWKYGSKRPDKFLGNWPKLRAIYLFLTTEIHLRKINRR